MLFCKDILHKSWFKVVLYLQYFYYKQLQIALMNSQGVIEIIIIVYRIISTITACNSQSSLKDPIYLEIVLLSWNIHTSGHQLSCELFNASISSWTYDVGSRGVIDPSLM